MYNPIHHFYRKINNEGLLYGWFYSMHTRVDIILHAKRTEDELMSVINDIFIHLKQIENLGNYYNRESELAYVNRYAARVPVDITKPLYDIFALCLEYNKKTLGCFDFTVHSKNYSKDTISYVYLPRDYQSVFFRRKGITINLSGFLKGYALDRIRELLEYHEMEDALVNIGNSSILALGNHPVGKGWKVSFENKASVTENKSSITKRRLKAQANQENTLENDNSPEIILYNECLTTSGNETPDRKHIICPQTGELIEGKRQVAVVTPSGAIGEILSTSLFVANEEQREAIIATCQPLKVIDF